MGRRGPAPTPTRLLELRGSWRAKTRDGEPITEALMPEKPEWLTGLAGAEWNRLSQAFHALGVLTALDRTALAMHCQAVADFIALQKVLNREGSLIEDEKGKPIPHPAAKLSHCAFERVLKSAQEFGLSPASRTRVRATPPTVADPDKERFFKTGKERLLA